MATISKDCNKCIHNDVCALKSCVREAEQKILDSGAGNVHPDIEFIINCRKFIDSDICSPFKSKGVV